MRLKWNRQNPAAGVNGRAFVMSELQTDARGPDRRELPPQCVASCFRLSNGRPLIMR